MRWRARPPGRTARRSVDSGSHLMKNSVDVRGCVSTNVSSGASRLNQCTCLSPRVNLTSASLGSARTASDSSSSPSRSIGRLGRAKHSCDADRGAYLWSLVAPWRTLFEQSQVLKPCSLWCRDYRIKRRDSGDVIEIVRAYIGPLECAGTSA